MFTNGSLYGSPHNAALNMTAADLLVWPRFGPAARRPRGQDPRTDQAIRRVSCGNDPLTGYVRYPTDTQSIEAQASTGDGLALLHRAKIDAAVEPTARLRDFLRTVTSFSKRSRMSIGTIVLIILILALVGVLPTWGHSSSWGYGPSGGIGLIVIILIVLLLLGKL
jgi:hypothetical protein